MKVRYIYPPLFKPFYPLATRVMTENLLKDTRLEPHFSSLPLRVLRSETPQGPMEELLCKASRIFPPAVTAFLRQPYMAYNVFYVFMARGYFDPFLQEDPEGECVLLTVINFCDLLIASDLLRKGHRVLLGGPLVNIGLSPAFIRSLLRNMGVGSEALQERLVVVSGNVDLGTDLYHIIKQWQDTAIKHNDYPTLFACHRDFLQEHYDSPNTIPVHIGLNNHCWYGKCRFCTYRMLPRADFLRGAHAGEVIANIRELMGRFRSQSLRFIDSYFEPHSPTVEEVVEGLKDYHVTVYSGISLLKRPSYARFLNRFADCLLIGLESCSDFSLAQIRKGYTLQDVHQAVDNLIRHLRRDMFLEISLILDLPAQDQDDVQQNYETVRAIKQRLLEAGFRVAVHMNILSVFPNFELLDMPGSRLEVSHDPAKMEVSSGKNFLIWLLRMAGMDGELRLPHRTVIRDEASTGPLSYGYLSSDLPVIRYDRHGQILPSDLLLMGEELMEDLLRREHRRMEEGGGESP